MMVAFFNPHIIEAAVIEDSEFKDSLYIENKKLDLTGTGLFRYWGFKAYVGALYLENGCTTDKV